MLNNSIVCVSLVSQPDLAQNEAKLLHKIRLLSLMEVRLFIHVNIDTYIARNSQLHSAVGVY